MAATTTDCHAAGRQGGTTLVEVLVTLVLVSIGLLGLAGLQLSSVQNTNSATQRYEATLLARDILERMRANRTAAVNGMYDLELDDSPGGGGVVADDLGAWMAALAALPGGDGAIEVLDGVATVTVVWTDISDEVVAAGADDSREMSLFVRTDL